MRGLQMRRIASWLGAVTCGAMAACGGDPTANDTLFGDSGSGDEADDDDGDDDGPGSATADSSGGASMSADGPSSESAGTDTSGGPTSDASAESSGATTPESSGPDETGSSSSAGDDESTTEGTTGPESCDCAPGTDVIYVLSDDAQLWSFDPITYDFALVGDFMCNGMNDTFSMGVDRNGIAWIMFQGQDLYTIDVNNPALCVDPGYVPGQLGFGLFGMAFVSEGENNPCDQLYVNSYSGGFGFQEGPDIGRLGTLDPDTLDMSEIGFTDYDGAELTGTGDGRLFAFAGVNPAKLTEFDKNDASVIDILDLDTLELTNAFAFAFFGGDFYFFTESGDLFSSQVTHLDWDDSDMSGAQELEVVVPSAPIRIVGAGVSTCVPVVEPM